MIPTVFLLMILIKFKLNISERTFRKAPQKPPSSVHIYGVNPSTVRVVWRYVAPSLDEEPVSGYKVSMNSYSCNFILYMS